MPTMSLSSRLTLAVFYLFMKFGITDVQTGCLEGRIRLVNGTVRTANEGNAVRVGGGRVQLCVGSQWTDLCSIDRNNRRRWHQGDIDVACRQLRNENSSILTRSPEATGNVVEAVGCLGYESRLVDCSILMGTDCELRESNINDCELLSDRECIEWEIQQDNTTAVRLCQDGVWRYVCGEFWTDTSAAVVCRQQNMPIFGSQGVKLSPNESTDPLRIHFSCTGAERTLMECRRIGLQNYINCSMVAGVKCPMYTQGLPPGPSPSHAPDQTVPGFSPVGWAVSIVIGLVMGAGGTALVLLVVVIAVRKRPGDSSPVSPNTGSKTVGTTKLENPTYITSSTYPTHIPQQPTESEHPYAVPQTEIYARVDSSVAEEYM